MNILHFIKRCAVTTSESHLNPVAIKVYDLQAFFENDDENSLVIEDISPNFNFVDHIAKTIEMNEVSKLHFSDIVEDFINDNYSVLN